MSMKGIVWIVGAGPGDVGLLTMRAYECISRADCIIYDRLVNKAILRYAKPSAELIYVGKEPYGHSHSQEQINQLLVTKVKQGLKVCRLKGGDPFIFGRGGEEAEALSDAGVPFEIVPGVSSFHAVPAYAGIPLTDRRFASSVAIVTGHEAGGGRKLCWKQLAKAVDTIVVLMGVERLHDITSKLIRGGLKPSTAAALVESGTLPSQRVIIGTLGSIAEEARRQGARSPAVLIVGDVVKLRSKLSWFEKKPLFGMRILVARDEERSFEMAQMIEAHGGNAVCLPVLKIELLSDTPKMRLAARRLSCGYYDWVVFTSVNGVRAFFSTLHLLGMDARAFGSTRVCAVGDTTAREMRMHGIVADAIPHQFTTEAMASLLKRIGIRGARILMLRAYGAPKKLAKELSDAGAIVHEVTAYRVCVNDSLSADEMDEALSSPIDIACFTSPSSLDALFKIAGRERVSSALHGATIACIGPVTATCAAKHGLSVNVVASNHTAQGLIDSVIEFVKRTRGR
ncbi:MAG: uroporphyrinogen-III C-methyltransferase [Armatimonadota bacterium]|nr:uroporphyrinogen-III C-methyltransferase [Armatimonadota bacterium]MDW8024568.1 uroporphyrinogen-III C-methyltransferase [Armatimonadota bacterium]